MVMNHDESTFLPKKIGHNVRIQKMYMFFDSKVSDMSIVNSIIRLFGQANLTFHVLRKKKKIVKEIEWIKTEAYEVFD